MGQIKVVTDTAASVPPDLAARHGMGIARYSVQFGTESFVDNGTDMTVDEFETKRTATGLVPKTAIPATGKLVDIYKAIAKPGDTIFSIHTGGKISGIVGAAQIAAQEVPDVDVVVFDSDIVCMAVGYMALEAAEAAEAGATKDQIITLLNDLRARRIDFLSISVELEYIKESGRIIGAEKAADAAVKNVPILRFQDGKPGVIEQGRTQSAVLRRIIELVKDRAAGRPIKRVAIIHANREQPALKYREMVERELAPQELLLGQLGITLMAHLGPGALCTNVVYGE
jgi:DegV family protein with EDD domain